MSRGRIAWAIAAVDLVVFTIAVMLAPTDQPALATLGANLLYVAGLCSFAGVGALLVNRVPTNPVGGLLLAAGTTLVAAVAIGTYGQLGALARPSWPGAALATVLGDAIFVYPIVIALIGVPLYFPDGRLLSPRYRWVVRLTIAAMVVWSLEAVRNERGTGSAPVIPGLVVLDPLLQVLEIFVLGAVLVGFGAAATAMAARFRHGDQVQREQVKWLLGVVALGAVVWPVSFLVQGDIGNALSTLGILILFALPVVIAIAILRYRLYEIDRIISRTIGWTLVTGILAGIFALTILAIQAVLLTYTQGQTVAVAASTLAVLVLFQPIRQRIQHLVDRRFDRARFDAERTSTAFAERLRDEIDIATVTSDLRMTAEGALSPSALGIWIREPVTVPGREPGRMSAT
jgi:hypothetical protein